MQLKIKIGYNEVFDLVKQLPKSDIKRLNISINKELLPKSIKKKNAKLVDLILAAPTWTDRELAKYLERREHINQFSMVSGLNLVNTI